MEKLAFIQGLVKNGVNQHDLVTQMLQSKDFQVGRCPRVSPRRVRGRAGRGCVYQGAAGVCSTTYRNGMVDVPRRCGLCAEALSTPPPPSAHTRALQKVYQHPEVLHKMLEANPLLHAIDGFKEAAGRRLSDAEVRGGVRRWGGAGSGMRRSLCWCMG
jgi:hypothetical protein